MRKELLWNLVFQHSNLVLVIVYGVVLVPLYLRFVSPAEFGLWMLITSVTTLVSLADPGLAPLYQQRVGLAFGGSLFSTVRQLTASGFKMTVLLAGTATVVGLAFRMPLTQMIVGEGDFNTVKTGWVLFLSIAAIGVTMICNFTAGIGIALLAPREHCLSWMIGASVGIISSVGLLWHGHGIIGLAIGKLFGVLSQLTHSGVVLRRQLVRLPEEPRQAGGGCQTLEQAVDWRILSLATLEKLSGALMVSADTFLLARLLGYEMVAGYVICKRPGDLVASLAQKTVSAFGPRLIELVGRKKYSTLARRIVKSYLVFFWASGFAAIVLYALLETVIDIWVGSNYYVGRIPGFLLVVLCITTSFGGMISNFYWTCGETNGYYRVNTVVSLATILAMGLGVALGGVNGLITGMILPRAVASFWLYPHLTLEALKVRRMARGLLRSEGFLAFCVTVGCFGVVALVSAIFPLHPGLSCIAGLAVFCSVAWGTSAIPAIVIKRLRQGRLAA